MALLHIVPDVAQGSAPWPHKVPQMRGNALGADPGHSAQRDGTAIEVSS